MEKTKKKPSAFLIILLCIVLLQIAAIVGLRFFYVLAERESDNNKKLPYSLVISEVCTDNFNVLTDEMGDTPGYIELYNNTDRVVDLSHYYLTDGGVSFRLPQRTLDPWQYRIVYASSFVPTIDENGEISKPKGIFCGFSVKSGDVLSLSDSENVLHRITVGELSENQSFSYIEDHFEKARPTPMEPSAMGDSLEGIPNPPKFSVPGGYYNEAQSVELTADGAKIYYTLDLSEPTAESTLYEGPITVCDSYLDTVIRAVAVTEDGRVSDIFSSTYLVRSSDGGKILSLVTNEALPDEEITGPASEIHVSLEYLEGSTTVFSENCGMRVLNYDPDNKEYVFYQRNLYNGQTNFSHSMFEGDKPIHSFILSFGDEDEAALQVLFGGAGLMSRKFAKTKVYMNGQYEGVATVYENYDSSYFKNYCGLDEEDFILLSDESHVMKEYKEYLDLMDFVANNDMTEKDNYASFADAVDVDGFIRYMAANLYLGNLDISQSENVLLFRSSRYFEDGVKNGKWHWLTGDLSMDCQYSDNTFDYMQKSRFVGSRVDYPILSSLLKNEDFKKQFVSTVLRMMNTVFEPNYAKETLKSLGIENKEINVFLEKRPEFVPDALRSALEITEPFCNVMVYCTEPDAVVTLNGIPLTFTAGMWSGPFAAGSVVEVEAEAPEGKEFLGWTGDVHETEPKITKELDFSTYLVAQFKEKDLGGTYEYSLS